MGEFLLRAVLVVNVLALCIVITIFLGDVILHILQKGKIEPRIAIKIARVAATHSSEIIYLCCRKVPI